MTLEQRLRSLLGDRSRKVGTIGVDAEMTARLGAVTVPADAQGAFDAVIWQARSAAAFDEEALLGLRSVLSGGGRLALVAPAEKRVDRDAATARQRSVVALSEAGYVLLDEWHLEDDQHGMVLVARPTRLTIRRYRKGDEPAIAALFARSFHLDRDQDVWRWKFQRHPWGREAISLAWDGEHLVGQYAALPMRLVRASGAEDRALQLCDIMTAPSVRGLGRGKSAVLVRMLRHLYACWAEHRIGFVIGWNTATSRAFALRFTDGKEAEGVGYWRRSAQAPTMVTAGYRVRPIERFSSRFDRFFDRVAPAYAYLQRRDSAYLSWRYAQPGCHYLRLGCFRLGRLVGWSVFRRIGDQLVWGDALVDPGHPAAAQCLLANALENHLATGAATVTAWFSPRPAWWKSILADLEFEPVPEPNDLSLIYGIHGEPATAELLASFYYTKADSDLF